MNTPFRTSFRLESEYSGTSKEKKTKPQHKKTAHFPYICFCLNVDIVMQNSSFWEEGLSRGIASKRADLKTGKQSHNRVITVSCIMNQSALFDEMLF